MPKTRTSSLFRLARSLHQRSARERTGRFLVEGIHQVGAAMEAGWEVDAILYSPDTLKSAYALDLVSRYDGSVEKVSATGFRLLAQRDNPQGIVAIVAQRHTRMDQLRDMRFGVGLVAPQDPGNVGTVLRTLDAVGGQAMILLDGGVEEFHPTVVRASMGALFWIPVVRAGFSEFQQSSLEYSWQLIGASAKATMGLREASPKQPWILLLGNEQKGLADEQKAACDITLSLPMRGHGSSLNLGVAAGILLYGLAA